MGFGVYGLGFGVWGLGFGVWGLGFEILCGADGSHLRFSVRTSGLLCARVLAIRWIEGLGFRVYGLGFRV